SESGGIHSKDEIKLIEEAHGVLGDWRSALQLLSRLVPQLELGGRWRVHGLEPDGSVVDSFFRHLVRGRQPSLAHRLLPSLGSALRFSTILTTNFDDLIEESFANAGETLQRFEVTTQAGLTAALLVLATR